MTRCRIPKIVTARDAYLAARAKFDAQSADCEGLEKPKIKDFANKFEVQYDSLASSIRRHLKKCGGEKKKLLHKARKRKRATLTEAIVINDYKGQLKKTDKGFRHHHTETYWLHSGKTQRVLLNDKQKVKRSKSEKHWIQRVQAAFQNMLTEAEANRKLKKNDSKKRTLQEIIDSNEQKYGFVGHIKRWRVYKYLQNDETELKHRGKQRIAKDDLILGIAANLVDMIQLAGSTISTSELAHFLNTAYTEAGYRAQGRAWVLKKFRQAHPECFNIQKGNHMRELRKLKWCTQPRVKEWHQG